MTQQPRKRSRLARARRPRRRARLARALAWRLPPLVIRPLLATPLGGRYLRYLVGDLRSPLLQREGYRGAIFIHVPKAAGMSIRRTLAPRQRSAHESYADFERTLGPRRIGSYFVYAFVRDPFDRLFSAWSFLEGGGLTGMDRRWVRAHLDQGMDFATFVESRLTPELAASIPHLAPQVTFLRDRHGGLGPAFIGRFERLEEDFAHVAARLGVEAKLPHLNATRRDPALKPVWTPGAVARVREVYAEDFRLLGYDPTP